MVETQLAIEADSGSSSFQGNPAAAAYKECLAEVQRSNAPSYVQAREKEFCGMQKSFDQAVDAKLGNVLPEHRDVIKEVGNALLEADPAKLSRILERYKDNPTRFNEIAKGLNTVLRDTGIQVEYDTNVDNIFEKALNFARGSEGTLKFKWNGGDIKGSWEFKTNGDAPTDHQTYKGSSITPAHEFGTQLFVTSALRDKFKP